MGDDVPLYFIIVYLHQIILFVQSLTVLFQFCLTKYSIATGWSLKGSNGGRAGVHIAIYFVG